LTRSSQISNLKGWHLLLRLKSSLKLLTYCNIYCFVRMVFCFCNTTLNAILPFNLNTRMLFCRHKSTFTCRLNSSTPFLMSVLKMMISLIPFQIWNCFQHTVRTGPGCWSLWTTTVSYSWKMTNFTGRRRLTEVSCNIFLFLNRRNMFFSNIRVLIFKCTGNSSLFLFVFP